MYKPEGIFVGARLSNTSIRQLREMARLVGISVKDINPKETHITLAYSKVPLRVPYIPVKGLRIKVRPTRLAYIGNFVALLVEGQWLRDQYNIVRANGASWDFPGFIPHISLMKNPPRGLQLGIVQPFLGLLDLKITETYVEPIKEK